MSGRAHVVWVKYDKDGPWFALERPARFGKCAQPLSEQQACREARELRDVGHPAKALPEGVDANAQEAKAS